jgi:hypothetical protein
LACCVENTFGGEYCTILSQTVFLCAWNAMGINPKCPVCIRDYEDGVHHFFKCKPVNKLWRACDLVNIRWRKWWST